KQVHVKVPQEYEAIPSVESVSESEQKPKKMKKVTNETYGGVKDKQTEKMGVNQEGVPYRPMNESEFEIDKQMYPARQTMPYCCCCHSFMQRHLYDAPSMQQRGTYFGNVM